MFRWITIVRLSGCDNLLSYELPWPERASKNLEQMEDFALLRYANVFPKKNLACCLATGMDNVGSVLLPAHCHLTGREEILTDLRDKDYAAVTAMLQALLPSVREDESKRFWVTPEALVDKDLGEKNTVAKAYIKKMQEFEMMMYAHPVNQYRRRSQQLPISKLMMGKVDNKPSKPSSVISDETMLSLFCQQQPLSAWLEEPTWNCKIVLGRNTGDRALYPLKETLLQMLENQLCDLVFVVQPGREDVYSSRWVHGLYCQLNGYKRLKQAI